MDAKLIAGAVTQAAVFGVGAKLAWEAGSARWGFVAESPYFLDLLCGVTGVGGYMIARRYYEFGEGMLAASVGMLASRIIGRMINV